MNIGEQITIAVTSLVITTSLALASCGYSATYGCEVSCVADGPCPDGFMCKAELGLCRPTGATTCNVAVDASDGDANVVADAAPSAVVTTLATGFNFPFGLAVDSGGNIWLADEGNHVVRELSSGGGLMKTVTGFSVPTGVAIDGNDTVYVIDYGHNTVCKIAAGGTVQTLAGLAGNPGSSDGSGSAARFNQPIGLAVTPAGDTIYVADSGNSAIRAVTPDGAVTTVTGSTNIQGTAVDSAGNIYAIGDDAVGKNSELLAGMVGIAGFSNGVGAAATFNVPQGLAVDSQGDVYVADSNNELIREVSPSGVVTAIAGAPGTASDADGDGSAARFNGPRAIAVVGNGHTIYVADSVNNAIRKITR